jgi:hypothetical protein
MEPGFKMNETTYGRKSSSIKKDLHKKITDWIASIADPNVRDLARKHTIVTGGSIASMLLGEQVNDFDVYFRNKETAYAVAQYYVSKFCADNFILAEVKEEVIKNIKGDEEDRIVIFIASRGVASTDMIIVPETYMPVFLSQNAITLSDRFQIITRFYGEPDKIHSNYDFSHAMNFYDYAANHLELKPDALECLLSRTLIYKGSLYPIASMFRLRKFIERGWRVSVGEMLKISWQISELDLTDRQVLREQLTGVDQAYLSALINVIGDMDTDKLNSTYMGEVIDRIFAGDSIED